MKTENTKHPVCPHCGAIQILPICQGRTRCEKCGKHFHLMETKTYTTRRVEG